MLLNKNFFDELDSNWGDAISDVYEQNDKAHTITLTYKEPVELTVLNQDNPERYSDKTIYVDKVFLSFYDVRTEDLYTRDNDQHLIFYLAMHNLNINLFLDGELLNKNNEHFVYPRKEEATHIIYYFGMTYKKEYNKIYVDLKTPFVNFITNQCKNYDIDDKSKNTLDTIKMNQPLKDLLLKTDSINEHIYNII